MIAYYSLLTVLNKVKAMNTVIAFILLMLFKYTVVQIYVDKQAR